MMNTKKLLSKADVAYLCGVSYSTLRYWLKTGLVKPPANGKGFTLAETRQILTDICREGTELTVAQTAERLGVNYHVFTAMRRNGDIPEGTYKGRRYYYAVADLDKIKQAVDKARAARPDGGTYQQARLREGLFNIVQAARFCHVPDITLRVHLAKGLIPKPTHQRGAYRYYTTEEVTKLAEWYGARRQPPKPGPLTF